MKNTCKDCGEGLELQMNDILGELCNECFNKLNVNLENPYDKIVRESNRLMTLND